MNIMRKGIATETILLLLIGIVVAGILIFMVYRYLISAPLSEVECKARMVSWCTLCKNSEWKSTIKLGDELSACLETYSGITLDGKTDCRNVALTSFQSYACGSYIPLD
jgi:hypothetical protein